MAWAIVLQRTGAAEHAEAALREVDRLLPTLEALPWLVADTAIRCGGVWLSIGERDRARELAQTAREALAGYPDAGSLPERLRHLFELLATAADLQLTPMELRLLPYLPTHLSLQEIAERFSVSRSTVKSHVESIYAKLEVTSRSEAVAGLLRLGLISGPFGSEATLEQG
jgi:LuxR family maltose regulon positive regulatory protein